MLKSLNGMCFETIPYGFTEPIDKFLQWKCTLKDGHAGPHWAGYMLPAPYDEIDFNAKRWVCWNNDGILQYKDFSGEIVTLHEIPGVGMQYGFRVVALF